MLIQKSISGDQNHPKPFSSEIMKMKIKQSRQYASNQVVYAIGGNTCDMNILCDMAAINTDPDTCNRSATSNLGIWKDSQAMITKKKDGSQMFWM